MAGLSLLACVYGTGSVHGHKAETVATIGGWVLLAGGVLGALIGAGHARERRAWQDYQDARTLVPETRRAWLAALGQSARRMTLPVVLAAVALLWAWEKGRHR